MGFSKEGQATSRSQLRYKRKKSRIYRKNIHIATKRLLDIAFSFVLLVLLTPLIIGIMYWLYRREGTPIFKRQLVAGRSEHSFIMFTFRTMTNPSQIIFSIPITRSEHLKWKHYHRRIQLYTITGSWLKKWKLYKLPQLYHVLKGDMSLIGPRVISVKIDEPYDQFQLRRVTMRPGMISYGTDHTQSLAHDLYYIHHWSLAVDLKVAYQRVCHLFRPSTKT